MLQVVEQQSPLVYRSAAALTVISAALAIARFATDGPTGPLGWILFACACAFAVSALLGRRSATEGIARAILPTAGFFGTFGMAWVEDGMRSEATFWFPIVPVVAVFLMNLRGGIVFAGLTLAGSCALAARDADIESAPTWLRLAGLAGAIVFGLIVAYAYDRQRSRSEKRLRAAHTHLQAMVDNLQAGVAITDESAKIVVINQRLCDIFGTRRAPAELVGANTWRAIREGTVQLVQPEAFRERIRELTEQRERVEGDEVKTTDGRAYERDFVPIELDGGRHGHVWSYFEVTHHRARERDLEVRLETDTLTGLTSRSHFRDGLEAACRDESVTCTLLYLDLDGFKEINDRHGHDAGDYVLREAGLRLQGCLRTGDVAARLGGDEFAVRLPETVGPGQLEAVARKVLTVLGRPYEWDDERLRVTASIGIARFPADAGDADGLVTCADEAMYAAKHAGKNRFAYARPVSRDSTA